MGWTLDYVLDMPIEAFEQVFELIIKELREERKAIEAEMSRRSKPIAIG